MSQLTFGAGHIMDVVRGKTTDKVAQYPARQGLRLWRGQRAIPEQQLRGVMRQLLATGALGLHKVTSENSGHVFDTLHAHAAVACRAARRCEGFAARIGGSPAHAQRQAQPHQTSAAAINLGPDAQVRFINLKAWRAEVAKAHDLPAYVIFNDATLVGIAERNPQTFGGLARHQRHWCRKLEAYGAEVLRVVSISG